MMIVDEARKPQVITRSIAPLSHAAHAEGICPSSWFEFVVVALQIVGEVDPAEMVGDPARPARSSNSSCTVVLRSRALITPKFLAEGEELVSISAMRFAAGLRRVLHRESGGTRRRSRSGYGCREDQCVSVARHASAADGVVDRAAERARSISESLRDDAASSCGWAASVSTNRDAPPGVPRCGGGLVAAIPTICRGRSGEPRRDELPARRMATATRSTTIMPRRATACSAAWRTSPSPAGLTHGMFGNSSTTSARSSPTLAMSPTPWSTLRPSGNHRLHHRARSFGDVHGLRHRGAATQAAEPVLHRQGHPGADPRVVSRTTRSPSGMKMLATRAVYANGSRSAVFHSAPTEEEAITCVIPLQRARPVGVRASRCSAKSGVRRLHPGATTTTLSVVRRSTGRRGRVFVHDDAGVAYDIYVKTASHSFNPSPVQRALRTSALLLGLCSRCGERDRRRRCAAVRETLGKMSAIEDTVGWCDQINALIWWPGWSASTAASCSAGLEDGAPELRIHRLAAHAVRRWRLPDAGRRVW